MRDAPDQTVLEYARSEECVLISADTDFGALLARKRAVKPCVMLIRRLVGRRAFEQSAVIQANLPLVAEDLVADAVVVVGDNRIRAALAAIPRHDLFARLRDLSAAEPETFQALSTVIAGAWLLTPGARERIGYRGLRPDKAGLDDAIEDLTGLLDPVIERVGHSPSRWIR